MPQNFGRWQGSMNDGFAHKWRQLEWWGQWQVVRSTQNLLAVKNELFAILGSRNAKPLAVSPCTCSHGATWWNFHCLIVQIGSNTISFTITLPFNTHTHTHTHTHTMYLPILLGVGDGAILPWSFLVTRMMMTMTRMMSRMPPTTPPTMIGVQSLASSSSVTDTRQENFTSTKCVGFSQTDKINNNFFG